MEYGNAEKRHILEAGAQARRQDCEAGGSTQSKQPGRSIDGICLTDRPGTVAAARDGRE